MDFKGFPKIARLSRDCIITEKIDGTNAQIYIGQNGEFLVGSRNRWITPEDDNFGFSKWANEHKEELLQLGVGTHYGEWWGSGIQRGYGFTKGEKFFSLFNTTRYKMFIFPDCCNVVPIIHEGMFTTQEVDEAIWGLKYYGSAAAKGFMNPEGIIIYHRASNTMFKKTIENDNVPKKEVNSV